MYIDINAVTTISSVGGGPIGAGWAAHFLSKGFKVKSYLHDIKEKSKLNPICNYSKNKLITEKKIKNILPNRYLILRVSNIIGKKNIKPIKISKTAAVDWLRK